MKDDDIHCEICGKYLGQRYMGTAKYLKRFGNPHPTTLIEYMSEVNCLYICSSVCQALVDLNPMGYGL